MHVRRLTAPLLSVLLLCTPAFASAACEPHVAAPDVVAPSVADSTGPQALGGGIIATAEYAMQETTTAATTSVARDAVASLTGGNVKESDFRESVRARILNDFTYHSPTPEQLPRFALIRNEARSLALKLNDIVPQSRELSEALAYLDKAVRAANAGIARNGDRLPEPLYTVLA